MTHSFRAAVPALRLDPGQHPIRDRAVLRIRNRARLTNAEQLGALVYRNRHDAQIRPRRPWEPGYLERSGLPPPSGIRGSPYVYRLAPAAIARLGYAPRPWRGPGYIAHTLDAVEVVCALVRSTDPESRPSVLRWLPESIAVDVLPAGPAAVCLEMDEGNQHVAPIREKLRAYRTVLGGRPCWHVLIVVQRPTARHGSGGPHAVPPRARVGHNPRRARHRCPRRPRARAAAAPLVLGSLKAGPSPVAGPPVGSRHS